ncbi:MAG: 4-vinyl reductase [Candidatus Bathyarchaeia archaeon]
MNYNFSPEKGIIRDKVTGDRCLIITRTQMQQIFERLVDIFQSGAQVIITEAFKAAGERYVTESSNALKSDPVMFLKVTLERFAEAGLGKTEIIHVDPKEGELTFRVYNNFFAEICSGNSTYCNCVAAFASGIYKQILNKKPYVKETKCIEEGDAYCEWYIKPTE